MKSFDKNAAIDEEEILLKKILILEDNKITMEHLVSLIGELEIQSSLFRCDNIRDAYQYALERDIDLFIVDIILEPRSPGDSSGLKFVDSIRKIEKYIFTPVIIVTSLEDAKLYTYEKLHCYSFVEKPFDPEKMKDLIRQCLKYPANSNASKTLYFRKDGIILSVNREDIVYVSSENHILNIHTKHGDVLSVPYITLKKFLVEADSADLVQCSRNTIINKNFIHNVDIPNQMIQLKNHMGSVEIGIMYKKYFRELLK